MKKQDQRDLGSTRLTAESSARSAGLELGAWDLAVQYGEFVAEHQDLEVFGGIAASGSTSSWTERDTARYASFDSTPDDLRRVDRAISVPSCGPA